jgi:ribosome-binding factor A
VTITDVEVDKELAYAEIFVSAVEGIQRSQEILEGFNHAQGYLRRELSHRLDLRVFPRLRFHWDPTFENADHIEKLLISIQQTDTQNVGKTKKKRAVKNEGA